MAPVAVLGIRLVPVAVEPRNSATETVAGSPTARPPVPAKSGTVTFVRVDGFAVLIVTLGGVASTTKWRSVLVVEPPPASACVATAVYWPLVRLGETAGAVQLSLLRAPVTVAAAVPAAVPPG